VQWKCWCSDPNTPLDCPGLDLNRFCRGGLCQPALPPDAIFQDAAFLLFLTRLLLNHVHSHSQPPCNFAAKWV